MFVGLTQGQMLYVLNEQVMTIAKYANTSQWHL
jgi:hypothetical protein